jgi:hypothetical protein
MAENQSSEDRALTDEEIERQEMSIFAIERPCLPCDEGIADRRCSCLDEPEMSDRLFGKRAIRRIRADAELIRELREEADEMRRAICDWAARELWASESWRSLPHNEALFAVARDAEGGEKEKTE